MAINLPPQNIDIECACLSSAILSKSALSKIVSDTFSEDYYLDKNRIIFEAIKNLSKEYDEIDLILLRSYLQKNNQLDSIGGDSYLTQIYNSVRSSNIDNYIKELKHYSSLRQIISLSSESMEDAYGQENPGEIIYKLSNQLKLINFESREISKLSDIMSDNPKDMQLDSTGYVETGIHALDDEIIGFLPDDFIILAARPSMGKTSLALNIAKNISIKDPVVFFSLEQSSEDVAIRLLCAETNIAFKKIKIANRLSPLEWDSIHKAHQKIKNLNLYIYDLPLRASEIISMSRKIIEKIKPKLIMTDYLQLIIPDDRKLQRHLQVQEITRSFKNFTKEVRIPHLAISQLSRASETRKDRRPILSDLRESGDIEQDGDKILFIYRDDLNSEEAELIIAKYRNGATGTLDLTFNGRAMKFS